LLAAGLASPSCNEGMEGYRQDGAPVISSIGDYEACFQGVPGAVGRISAETRYCRKEKQLLF